MGLKVFGIFKEVQKMLDEVAPPAWGHTKAEKEKTKPDKPKSKIGGTAAAFKKALDDGRFKGLPGDKTKKEKTASMFKLMWSMKKKGAKPHYKPGTDEKYKKYQDEEVSRRNKPSAIKKKKTLEKLLIDKEVSKIQKDEAVKDPSKKKPKAPEFNAAKELVQKSPYMKPALQQKEDVELHDADGNLFATIIDVIKPEPMKVPQSNIPYIDEKLSTKDTKNLNKASILSHSDDPKDQDRARARKTEVDYKDLLRQIASKRKMKQMEEGKSWTDFKKVLGVRKKKKEEKKPEKAMDAGARAKRKLARRDYADKVSGSTENVPDEIKDHKSW